MFPHRAASLLSHTRSYHDETQYIAGLSPMATFSYCYTLEKLLNKSSDCPVQERTVSLVTAVHARATLAGSIPCRWSD